MPEIDKEDSYGETIVHGLELDDGTYLECHNTDLEHENGTRFTFSLSRLHDFRCRVFGWRPYGIEVRLDPEAIQKMYDDGVLEIVEDDE